MMRVRLFPKLRLKYCLRKTVYRKYFLSIALLVLQLSLAIILAQPSFSSSQLETRYYISPSGDDSNSGITPNTPWKTIERLNQVVFKPGDQILFEGGATFSGNLMFDHHDQGTDVHPIVISSYGVGKARIDAGTGTGILVYNAAGYDISNLQIFGLGVSNNTGCGISFYSDLEGNIKLDFINIEDVEVYGFRESGISIGSWNKNSGYRKISITDVLTHDNGDNGLITYSQLPNTHENVYVGYVQAYNNFGIAGKRSPSGNGILLGGVSTGTVEWSIAHDNGKFDDLEFGPVGIWAYDSTNITIQHNESYSNRTGSPVDGDGFDLDQHTSNSVLQYNYSHDNDGAGFLLCQQPDSREHTGNVIRYNISQNDGRKNNHGAIHVYGRVLNTEVYNNTIFVSPSSGGLPSGIRVDNWGAEDLDVSQVHFRNNIIQTTGGISPVIVSQSQLDGARSLLFQSNNYYSTGQLLNIRWGREIYQNLSLWRNRTAQEKLHSQTLGLTVDPQLLNAGGAVAVNDPTRLDSLEAYRLAPHSPLINAGIDLQSLFSLNSGSKDFYHTSIPQSTGYDIGAYEFIPTDRDK